MHHPPHCPLDSLGRPFSAVVVGATGGIGRALVAELLAHTQVARLVATGRTEDRLAALAADYGAGGRLECRRLDPLDEPSLAKLADEVEEADIPLQLVIVATGMLHDGPQRPEKRLEEVSPSWLANSFAVNAILPMMIMKHLGPKVALSGRSVIASLSARVGSIGDNRLGGWYGYRSSKAALNQLVRCSSIELKRRRPDAICVALHPGTVETPLSQRFTRNLGPDRLFSPQRAARQLLHVIDGLEPEDTGAFFAWDGAAIPW